MPLYLQVFLYTFRLQNHLIFRTFQEFHFFHLILQLMRKIFRPSQKTPLLFLMTLLLN